MPPGKHRQANLHRQTRVFTLLTAFWWRFGIFLLFFSIPQSIGSLSSTFIVSLQGLSVCPAGCMMSLFPSLFRPLFLLLLSHIHTLLISNISAFASPAFLHCSCAVNPPICYVFHQLQWAIKHQWACLCATFRWFMGLCFPLSPCSMGERHCNVLQSDLLISHLFL